MPSYQNHRAMMWRLDISNTSSKLMVEGCSVVLVFLHWNYSIVLTSAVAEASKLLQLVCSTWHGSLSPVVSCSCTCGYIHVLQWQVALSNWGHGVTKSPACVGVSFRLHCCTGNNKEESQMGCWFKSSFGLLKRVL